MSLDSTHLFAEQDVSHRLQQYPRNIWTKFRAALDRIEAHDFYGARRLLEGLKYHPEASEDICAIYWQRLMQAEAQQRPVRKINIPSDYTGSLDERLLLPFRRLNADQAVPKPYPWAMALPPYAGAGNSYRFLQEAAAGLAGHFTPAVRRVHVVWSPLAVDASAQRSVLAGLCDLVFAGRLDVTVFGGDGLDAAAVLPGQGTLSLRAHALQSSQGQSDLRQIVRDCDQVLFVAGAPAIDRMLLQRGLQLAEISDAVVQPVVPMPTGTRAGQGFATLYSDAALRERFSGRYPFRDVAGLNMLVPARLLREIGLTDPRFASTTLAARELAYRASVRGAWLCPLAVDSLAGHSDQEAFPAEQELYKALCPNHWDRKRDVWHEVSKVSVYIPAYNASKYIERAVESVLAQDVADLEVCIANDGS
ncbi:glycosyltransferase family 2 protein, partial [Pseudotabrizicola algicola]